MNLLIFLFFQCLILLWLVPNITGGRFQVGRGSVWNALIVVFLSTLISSFVKAILWPAPEVAFQASNLVLGLISAAILAFSYMVVSWLLPRTLYITDASNAFLAASAVTLSNWLLRYL